MKATRSHESSTHSRSRASEPFFSGSRRGELVSRSDASAPSFFTPQPRPAEPPVARAKDDEASELDGERIMLSLEPAIASPPVTRSVADTPPLEIHRSCCGADRPSPRRDEETIARTPEHRSEAEVDVRRSNALRVTDPREPDEIAAERFATVAMAALSQISTEAQASVRPASTTTPAASIVSTATTSTSASSTTAPAPAPAPETETDEALEAEDELGDVAEAVRRPAPGTPLSPSLRGRIEPVVGSDLGHVRVHTDGRAGAMAEQLDARAFTHGPNVFFSRAAFEPDTRQGLHLLLHEIGHVIQHTAGARRNGVVARGPLRGKAAHTALENLLIKQHDLMADGILAGGSTSGKGLDVLGCPDLMWSSSGNAAPWIRGRFDDEGRLHYVPASVPKLCGHPRGRTGKAKHDPTVSAAETFSGEFADYAVAEIKPIGLSLSSLAKAGEGLAQSNNYVDGFREFADQAKTDGKITKTPNITSLTTRKDLLPPPVDYNQFELEAAKPTPGTPNLVFGDRRYWAYPLQSSPVLFYFDLPHPYEVSDYTKKLDELFLKLEGLRAGLGKKQTAGKIGLSRNRVSRRRRRPNRAGPPRALRVARKTDWKAEGAAWETKRKDWDDKSAKPFLKSKAGKALDAKDKIDSTLKITKKDDAKGAERNRKFKQVERFSGKTGVILGKIRFALGPVFDKLSPLFEWLKKKLKSLVDRIKAGKTLSVSWTQTVFDTAMAALGTVASEVVGLLFGKFQDCIHGMIDGFIQSFTKDLGEQLAEPFEKAKQGFFSWLGTDEATFGELMKDVEAAVAKYGAIIDTITDAKRLVREIQVYEVIIRSIVQAASCVSPPLFGCLWGVVAQLALPAIVGLAARTDTFQNLVVRPLVRDLVRDIFDEPFSKLVNKSVNAIGLGEHAKGIPACDIKAVEVSKIVRQAVDNATAGKGLSIGSGEFRKQRDAWAKANHTDMLNIAAKLFVSPDGKVVTPAQLEKLLEQMKDLVPEAGNMADAAEQAQRSDGKIDLAKFTEWAQGSKAARPRPKGGSWSSDSGGTSSPADVTKKLDTVDLTKVSPGRLVELIEDSRSGDSRVNVDQLVRKVEVHLEREKIKADADAKELHRPGVPTQGDSGFSDGKGGKATQQQVRALVDSLAGANLGEVGGESKIAEATGADGKTDVTKAKGGVDMAVAPAAPQPGPAPQTGPTSPAPNQPFKPGPRVDPLCLPPFCLEKSLRDSGGRDRSPIQVGPQEFKGPDGSGSVLPGVKIPLP
jgi:hypothetical protein